MHSSNPFEPPQAPMETPPPPIARAGGVWRKDNVLIVGRFAKLPSACVKCCRPEVRPLHKKLSWHPSWIT